jgi:hypothetical protein
VELSVVVPAVPACWSVLVAGVVLEVPLELVVTFGLPEVVSPGVPVVFDPDIPAPAPALDPPVSARAAIENNIAKLNTARRLTFFFIFVFLSGLIS